MLVLRGFTPEQKALVNYIKLSDYVKACISYNKACAKGKGLAGCPGGKAWALPGGKYQIAGKIPKGIKPVWFVEWASPDGSGQYMKENITASARANLSMQVFEELTAQRKLRAKGAENVETMLALYLWLKYLNHAPNAGEIKGMARIAKASKSLDPNDNSKYLQIFCDLVFNSAWHVTCSDNRVRHYTQRGILYCGNLYGPQNVRDVAAKINSCISDYLIYA